MKLRRAPDPATLWFLLAFAVSAAPAALAQDAAAPDTATRLSLADAVRAAASGTPAVQIAQLHVDQAKARIGEARGAYLPGISGTASDFNRTFSLKAQGITFPSIPGSPLIPDPIGPVGQFDARVHASQAIVDIAAIQKVKSADQGERQSQANRGTTSETAAQSTALAYLRAVRAQELVSARQADLQIASDLLDLANAQQAAGTAPNIDATRARSQMAVSRSQLILARNLADQSQIDLARSLGLDPGTRFVLTDTLGSQSAMSDAPEEPQTAVGTALERRSELMAERAAQSKARYDASAISSERIPRLEALGDWGLSGQHAYDGVTTYEYGLALTWPLIDGGRRESRISEQRSVLRESQVREKDLRDQIAADVRGALLDIASGREQQQVASERLSLAGEELAQARERFVNGVAGNIEVIDAQSSLIRARDVDIEARFAVAAARVALARAVGVARTLR